MLLVSGLAERAAGAALWPCLGQKGWRTGQLSPAEKNWALSKTSLLQQLRVAAELASCWCSYQNTYPNLLFPGGLSILVTYQRDAKCISLFSCLCLLDIPLTCLIFAEEGSCGLAVQTLRAP